MFDLGRFIAECRAAVSLDASHRSVREIVARAVSEPTSVIALGNAHIAEPKYPPLRP
jgi:hypothetical protein